MDLVVSVGSSISATVRSDRAENCLASGTFHSNSTSTTSRNALNTSPSRSKNPLQHPGWFPALSCWTSCLLRHNDLRNRLQWHPDPSALVVPHTVALELRPRLVAKPVAAVVVRTGTEVVGTGVSNTQLEQQEHKPVPADPPEYFPSCSTHIRPDNQECRFQSSWS